MDFLKFLVWVLVQFVFAVAVALSGAALFLSEVATELEMLYDERGHRW